MKKILILLLIVCTVIFLAECGGSSKGSANLDPGHSGGEQPGETDPGDEEEEDHELVIVSAIVTEEESDDTSGLNFWYDCTFEIENISSEEIEFNWSLILKDDDRTEIPPEDIYVPKNPINISSENITLSITAPIGTGEKFKQIILLLEYNGKTLEKSFIPTPKEKDE